MSHSSRQKINLYDEKIVYGPAFNVTLEENGLGERYFRTLDTFQDKLMQVDALTGITETASSVKVRAIQVAIELQRLGITCNDIVVMCCIPRLDQTIVTLACLFVATQLAVLEPEMTAQEFNRKMMKLNPKVLFCDVRIFSYAAKDKYRIYVFGKHVKRNSIKNLFTANTPVDSFVPIHVFRPENKTAFIILTEGTTGPPKLVRVSHVAVFMRTMKMINILLKDIRKVVSYYPLMGTAQIILICCFFETNIVRIVAHEFMEREACRIIHDMKVDVAILGTLNTKSIADYINNGSDFNISCLRRILIGGIVTSPSMLVYLNKTFSNVEVLNVYSLAECGIVAGMTPDNLQLSKFKPATLGTVFPGGKIKIIDLQTKTCVEQDTWGELCYSGPDVALCYFDESPREFLDGNYYKTGDIAQFDEQGCLYIYGRLEDKFDVEAHTFFAVDLECILMMHSHVKDCIVAGNGGQIDAYVTVKNITTRDLFKWLEQKVPPYMMPHMIYIVTNIPRTNNGKVQKYLMAKNMSRKSIVDGVSD